MVSAGPSHNVSIVRLFMKMETSSKYNCKQFIYRNSSNHFLALLELPQILKSRRRHHHHHHHHVTIMELGYFLTRSGLFIGLPCFLLPYGT
jgi:hypothetical protein